MTSSVGGPEGGPSSAGPSSPFHQLPPHHPQQQHQQQQQGSSHGSSATAAASSSSSSNAASNETFNMGSFDFGSDFSLPTSLDELSIFGAVPSNNSQQTSHPASSTASGATVSNQASPRQPFSPRMTKGSPHRMQSTGSRNGSPHPLSIQHGAESDATTTRGSGSALSDEDLQGLLAAMQQQQQHQQSQHREQPQQPQLFQHQPAHQRQQATQMLNVHAGTQLSVSDLEKLLVEKEQAERVQQLQTLLLRQQLEALSRQQSSGSDHPPNLSSVNLAALLQQQQNLLRNTSQQSPTAPSFGSFGGASAAGSLDASTSQAFSSQASQKGMHAMSQYGLITPLSSGAFNTRDTAAHSQQQQQQPFMSPLKIPAGSQPSVVDAGRVYDASMVNGAFTPLESPAITPASVFSNASNATTTADLFSPLTSPALRPQYYGSSHDAVMASPLQGPVQPGGAKGGRLSGRARTKAPGMSPHFGPQSKNATPNASPALGPTKPASVPRKNRSTTAEARANRARPSPLVKPSQPPASVAKSRHRGQSGSSSAGLPSPAFASSANTGSRRNSGSQQPSTEGDASNGGASHSRTASNQTQVNTFTPILGSASKPMDASPSEGAASTPSPIDLSNSQMPPPSSKPMTPSSIMGIQQQSQGRASSKSSSGSSNGRSNSSSTAKGGKGSKPSASSEKSVSFAQDGHKRVSSANGEKTSSTSPGALASILPGGISPSDRESWMNIKSSGGGLESRRTSHKAAEQKRRDSLKFCFDELRTMLPAITLDDEAPGGSSLGPDGRIEDEEQEAFDIEQVGDAESARIANRAISKVALLRHSNEYLIRLKNRLERRDEALDACRREIAELRRRLGLPQLEEGFMCVMEDQTFPQQRPYGEGDYNDHEGNADGNGLQQSQEQHTARGHNIESVAAPMTHDDDKMMAGFVHAQHHAQQHHQPMDPAAFSYATSGTSLAHNNNMDMS